MINEWDIPQGDDEDLLHPERAASRAKQGNVTPHKFDGTPCPRCKDRVHHITASDSVPPEIYEQLGKLVDDLPDVPEGAHEHILIAETTPGRAKLLHDFLEFTHDLGQMNREGPLLRAVAEVLDDMSGGAVQTRWRIYRAEQALLSEHVVLKAIGFLREACASSPGTTGTAAMLALVDELVKTTQTRLEQSVERYRALCQELGLDPDESLVHTGEYSEEHTQSVFAGYTMAEPFRQEVARQSEMRSNEPPSVE